MSVGGPCLWLPSLSSPVPSPLSAVSSHLSARSSDRFSLGPRNISPRLSVQKKEEPGVPASIPSRFAEMQPTGHRAENALGHSGAQPSGMAASVPYPGRDVSSRDTINHRLEAAKQDMLPGVKLEIPSLNQRVFSATQPLVGHGGHSEETVVSSFAGSHDPRDDHGPESTVSPDDDKDMMGSDDNNRSPSMEKKKMKRFRLTHNQTRFLMSEFTRQAHPDAAHRERLSKEIPGLTPRQVQVWFQNRRAKLKRLTTNDRERMLKSRALPDDFDTTKVLRTPFEGKSSGVTPVASPSGYSAPNPDFGALRTLRTERFPRPNEDEYLVSPLSSASTAGPYMSSTGQGQMFRPAASASMSDLHRNVRNDYSITRSSSLSDASAHPSPYAGYGMPNRFAGPQANQPGMPYMSRPMEYAVPRHPGIPAYDQHQSFEGSVSPTESHNAHMAYDMNPLGSQPPNYNLGMASQLPTQGRPLAMQNLPVSAAPDYRHYAYDTTAAPMGSIPYTQSNPSNLTLPSSFGAESGSKFGTSPYNYANYIQQ
ncbi:Homeodomain [Penicillium brevicompactum]|uniref:Homeodomain n=1 Tax=Penicillium brevicompactum TaxID=5074 RepID=UPI0025418F0A|nr:Homeodomain [Penicillium brevicompactum]KAJ5348285.1 Homeodomain [Penicillium brevicompactum]